MNYGIYSIVFFLFIIVFYIIHKNNKFIGMKIKAKKGGIEEMKELAKSLLEKDCVVTIFDSSVNGKITEVSENGMIVKTKKNENIIINLDFVIRIQESPAPKKKKSKE